MVGLKTEKSVGKGVCVHRSRFFYSSRVVFFLVAFISAQTNGGTSITNISVVGVVPSFFSVTSAAQVTELDFGSAASAYNRVIGILRFKYNENVQSLDISASTASGLPEDSNGVPFQFGAGGFQVAFNSGCVTVDPAYTVPFTLTNAGVDVKSALAAALMNQGVEEECQLLATYTSGLSGPLPRAGRFSMNIVVTMISN